MWLEPEVASMKSRLDHWATNPSYHPRHFLLTYFRSLQSAMATILQQINVKHYHPVSDAGIQTDDLSNMRFIP